MITGKIIKGIAGFYYVHTPHNEIFECKAKGIFRKEKLKPLVGDEVVIDIISQEEKKGNIQEILPRKNQLIRPAVSNIDQILVIFAISHPKPNFHLLDKFLISMEAQKIPAVICFNKEDLVEQEELLALQHQYEKSGYPVIFTSADCGQGKEELMNLLDKKTTAVAGPSGVGKSSLINMIQTEVQMETGGISEKIERGKHTTRHSQLIFIKKDTYIMDTPGFSSLYVNEIEKEQLREYFQEFLPFQEQCRFLGCSHIHEPDCGVKEALKEGKIHKERYQNYILIYEELKEGKRY